MAQDKFVVEVEPSGCQSSVAAIASELVRAATLGLWPGVENPTFTAKVSDPSSHKEVSRATADTREEAIAEAMAKAASATRR